MHLRFVAILIYTFCFKISFAQSVFIKWFDHPFTAADTNYIQPNPDRWSLRLNSTYKLNNYSCKFANSPISYTGKTSIGFGAGFSFRNFVADVAVKTQPYHTTENVFINALKSDMVFSMYNHQHLIDGQAQFYDGYVEEELQTHIIMHSNSPITVRNFGLQYNYLRNYKHFSMTAAMIGSEIQKHSAGSFLIGGGVNYFHLATALIDPLDLKTTNIVEGSLSAGCAGTLVFHPCFVMLNFTPTLNFEYGVNDNDYTVRNGFVFALASRDAIGINLKHFYFIATSYFNIQQTTIVNKTQLLFRDFGRLPFVLGYRFY